MFRLIILISCALVVSSALKTPLKKFNSDNNKILKVGDESYRLQTNIIPISYDIQLTTYVHAKNTTFNGIVNIAVESKEKNSEEIILHINYGIIIDEIYINNNSVNYMKDEIREFLKIQYNTIVGRKYNLKIIYHGDLSKNMAGFYKSTYLNKDKEEVWLATTQFEPTDARHAFPCFDEPNFKAKFNITIIHGQGYSAVSNMPVSNTKNLGNSMVQTKFAETPVMSTYLIAFIVSDFDMIVNNATKLPGEIFHEVIVQPNKIDQAKFALEAGEKILRALITYLNVEYEIPKMTQAAIPDFSAGAMENWGLVTYRVPYLLNDPQTSPKAQEESIASIIAHEFAHQWFGNRVTPKWWTYIWLSEGFATLFSNLISDIVYPQWKSMEAFVLQVVQVSLGKDARENSRIMSKPVFSPSEINSLFDDIAYAKSGCVLRMIMHALTEKTFKTGLKRYLDKNENQGVDQKSLFDALEWAANNDNIKLEDNLNVIMSTWSMQPGYPVLTVTRNYNNNSFTLSQERFLANTNQDKTNATWYLPYNFQIANEDAPESTKPDGWIQNVKTAIISDKSVIRNLTNEKWILFNINQTSYYRVNYDIENWELLIKQLNSNKTKIGHLNRAQLIDDSLNLAKSGRLTYDIALRVTEHVKTENEYIPLSAAYKTLVFCKSKLSGTSSYQYIERFIKDLTSQTYKELGVVEATKATESYHDNIKRKLVMNLACSVGVKECRDETLNKVKENMNTQGNISVDLFENVLCNGMRTADQAVFNFYFKLAHSLTEPNQRSIYFSSLACSENTENLNFLLQSTKQKNETLIGGVTISYTVAERITIYNVISSNSIKELETLLNFFDENSEAVNATTQSLSAILISTSTKITTVKFFEKMKAIMTKAGLSNDEIKIALDTIDENLNWVKENEKVIDSFLDKLYKEDDDGSASSILVSTLVISLSIIVTILNIL